MARPDPSQLSPLQLAVMRVLWQNGEARTTEVHAELARERAIAPTTVATLLSRLEKRGFVTHRTERRQFVYRALEQADRVSRSMVARLTDSLFGGDPSELVVHLLQQEDMAPGDLAHIKRLIEEKERRPERPPEDGGSSVDR